VFGALQIIAEVLREGGRGSVVTMICDSGDRYLGTYYDCGWLQDESLELEPYIERLEAFARSGQFQAS
jgi:cysteine synthase A